MHTSLVILAGGASSRMKKHTDTTNLSSEEIKQANERSKTLIGVGPNGRPLMDYLLFNAKQAGYSKIYIVIGEEDTLFNQFYGKKLKDNDFYGLKLSFARQSIHPDRVKPFGTADALYQATKQYPELNAISYSVCNSDNLYSMEALYALRSASCANAFISYDRDALRFPSERISSFAVAKLDDNNYLLDIIEKPTSHQVEQYRDENGKIRVSMNAFKFNGRKLNPFLEKCPVHPIRNEKELPTAMLNMINEGSEKVLGIPFSEHVPDLTAKQDIADVKEYLRDKFTHASWQE